MQNERQYPVTVSILTRRFDENGSGERDSYTYRGRVTEDEQYTLVYTAGEGGEAQNTALSFSFAAPARVELVQSGAVNCRLSFAAGEEMTALYRIPGVGTIDVTVTPRTVDNREEENGRRIHLDYDMTVGGVRSRTVMTVTVKK